LLEDISTGKITGKDLTIDERRLLVQFLKVEGGKTQDQISKVLQVSRRTVVNDFKFLREQSALAMERLSHLDLGGEIYDVAMAALRKAFSAGQYKTVSTIIRDLVETLQGLGLVYRAPLTSKQMQFRATADMGQAGYAKYMDQIDGERDRVVAALDEMVSTLAEPTKR